MDKAWRRKLQELIDRSGLTPKEITRRARVNPTLLHDVLQRDRTPSVENIYKICQVLNCSLSELFEGAPRVQVNLRVNGVSTGGGMWGEVPQKHGRYVPLDFISDNLATVEVADNDLSPRFERGDIISGPRQKSNFDNLLNLDCIALTVSGQAVIGTLLRGREPNTFDVRFFDRTKADLRDARLTWAAPIRMIIRGS